MPPTAPPPAAPQRRAELRRVTLRGHGDDALLARLRLERALAPVDWHPPGLPDGAVLCLRRLRAHAPAAPGFGERIHDALGAQLRRARRPWHDAAAGEAEAVWFDRGELAACLVRDQRHGRVGWHWWWRGVLAGRDPAQWLREQVLGSGAEIVALIDRLAARGEAGGWLARLPPRDAEDAWRCLVRDYALPEAAMPYDDPFTTAPASASGESALRDGSNAVPAQRSSMAAFAGADRFGRSAALDARVVAELLDTVPELRDPRLGPPQRRVLAYALIARRAPARLRGEALARAIALHLAAAAIAARPDPREPVRESGAASLQYPRSGSPVAMSAAPSAAPPAAAATHHAYAPSAQASSVPDNSRFPSRSIGQPQSQSHHRPSTDPSEPADAAAEYSGNAPVAPVGLADRAERVPGPDREHNENAAAAIAIEAVARAPLGDHANAAAIAEPTPSLDVSIETAFGGLFYLLNAALAMDLYGDFSRPRTRSLDLSPWSWLAWLGTQWFGHAFERDPLAALLAECAGDARPPVRGFSAPRDWRIAPDWLQPWGPPAGLVYRADPRRLRVWHAQGFALLDLPRDRDLSPRDQAVALCAAYRPLHPPTRARGPRPAPRGRNARWLRHLSDYLERRLQRALDLELAPPALRALVCRHRARVHCDLTGIDVHLSLAQVPLPVRIAGLDRDPGWIPAAGRSVRFHFDRSDLDERDLDERDLDHRDPDGPDPAPAAGDRA